MLSGASWESRAAGPCLVQGFSREQFKAFVHPRRPRIDISDDHPDGLSDIDPVGHADAKA